MCEQSVCGTSPPPGRFSKLFLHVEDHARQCLQGELALLAGRLFVRLGQRAGFVLAGVGSDEVLIRLIEFDVLVSQLGVAIAEFVIETTELGVLAAQDAGERPQAHGRQAARRRPLWLSASDVSAPTVSRGRVNGSGNAFTGSSAR